MDSFSMRGAWSFGLRFFAHRQLLHILILIGMGIAVPLILQFAVFGRIMGMANPAMLSEQSTSYEAGTTNSALAQGWKVTTAPLVLIFGYFLQIASYFASWRLGFSIGRPAPEAFLFGLLASLLTVGVFALVG